MWQCVPAISSYHLIGGIATVMNLKTWSYFRFLFFMEGKMTLKIPGANSWDNRSNALSWSCRMLHSKPFPMLFLWPKCNYDRKYWYSYYMTNFLRWKRASFHILDVVLKKVEVSKYSMCRYRKTGTLETLTSKNTQNSTEKNRSYYLGNGNTNCHYLKLRTSSSKNAFS